MNDSKIISILKLIGKVLVAILLIIVITVILSIAAAVIALKLHPELIVSMEAVASDDFFIKAALWAQILGFISGVYLAYYIFERKKGWSFGLNRSHFGRHMGTGFGWGAVLILLSSACIWLFGGIHIVSVQWSADKGYQIGGGFLLFIGVALNEELFARGYLQGLAKHQFGAKAAVVISTIVFALLHSFNPGMWSTPLPLINLLLAGLLFGICREASGSLWMPIGLHLSWNFVQGCVLGFDVSGIPMASVMTTATQGTTIVSGGAFGAEGSLVTSFVLVLGIVMIYNYYQTRNSFERISQVQSKFNREIH